MSIHEIGVAFPDATFGEFHCEFVAMFIEYLLMFLVQDMSPSREFPSSFFSVTSYNTTMATLMPLREFRGPIVRAISF